MKIIFLSICLLSSTIICNDTPKPFDKSEHLKKLEHSIHIGDQEFMQKIMQASPDAPVEQLRQLLEVRAQEKKYSLTDLITGIAVGGVAGVVVTLITMGSTTHK